jgi:hypothetical protein
MKRYTGYALALTMIAGSYVQEAYALKLKRNVVRAACGTISAASAFVGWKLFPAPALTTYTNARGEKGVMPELQLNKIKRWVLRGILASSGLVVYYFARCRTVEHKLDVVQADLDQLVQKNPLATALPKDGTPFLSMIEGMYPGESGIFKAAVDLRESQVKLVTMLDVLADARKDIAGDEELTQQTDALIARAQQAVFNITTALTRVEKQIKKSPKEFIQAQNA